MAEREPDRRRALLTVVLLLAACVFPPKPPGPFYHAAPGSIPRAPGQVIRHEPISGAPAAAQAYRVLYSSTGLKGEPIAVSGTVIIPSGRPPTGGWDVVAWAHGTTGVATDCAPSLRERPLANIPALARLLARGYVVTATDYPGLGTAGPHPYLVGVSEGRAVLDLVRAARNLPGESVGPRFIVWGHSQGGQAALFAGEIATSYAPELALAGVGAVAPATDLAVLLDDDVASPAGRVLVPFAIWSWSRVYDAPIDSLVKLSAMPAVNEVAAGCVESYGEVFHVALNAEPLGRHFLYHDPDSLAPWHDRLEQNRAGQRQTGAPLVIFQGLADPIVRPAVTETFAARLCRQGETVRYVPVKKMEHMGAANEVAPAVVDWIFDRFAGNPAPSDCDDLLKSDKPSG